jgi:hypothetical protein
MTVLGMNARRTMMLERRDEDESLTSNLTREGERKLQCIILFCDVCLSLCSRSSDSIIVLHCTLGMQHNQEK